MSLCIVWLYRKCFLPLRNRVVNFAFSEQDSAKIIIGIGVIRSQSGGFLVMRYRLTWQSLSGKRVGKIVLD